MKHIYSIFLSAVSLLWMLSGCVEDPDMDTRLQKAKAPEVSETSMEGEAYASSITLKAQIMKENGLPVKECGVCWSTQTGTEPLENMRNKRYTKADKIENHNFKHMHNILQLPYPIWKIVQNIMYMLMLLMI